MGQYVYDTPSGDLEVGHTSPSSPEQAESADPANTAAPIVGNSSRSATRPVIGVQPTSRANARNDANDPSPT